MRDAGLVVHRPAGRGDRRDGQQDGGATAGDRARTCPWFPARPRRSRDADEARAIAEQFGYPVLLKAAAGGGGKGMRVVRDAERDRRRRSTTARREAKNAFGDDAVYVEKYIVGPRHVEIQVLGDQHGTMLSLNERECSVQRRHQKMIEEAPSVAVTPELRRAMGETAVRAASAAGYVNAGTCEFLLDRDGKFYFLEMNTRLQVEHPVTELVTGIDLVQWQIRIAAGERLPFTQDDIVPRGWAIECRITSEDPANGFLPSTGRISYLHLPSGPGVRWDGGIEVGSEIGLFYDPMLAKLIVHAPTREAAVERMHRALLELTIEGVESSRDFHLRVMEDAEFRAGAIEIQWLERRLDSLIQREAPGERHAHGRRRSAALIADRDRQRAAAQHAAVGAAASTSVRRVAARGAHRGRCDEHCRGDDRLDRRRRRRHRAHRRRRRVRAAHGAGRPRARPTRHAKALRARRPSRRSSRRRRSASSRSAITIAMDNCGGCQLQHMRYDAQLEAKRGIIRDTLTRIGKRSRRPPDRSSRVARAMAVPAQAHARDAPRRQRRVGDRTAPVRRSGRRLSARRLPDHRRACDGRLATGHGGAAALSARRRAPRVRSARSTTARRSSWKAAHAWPARVAVLRGGSVGDVALVATDASRANVSSPSAAPHAASASFAQVNADVAADAARVRARSRAQPSAGDASSTRTPAPGRRRSRWRATARASSRSNPIATRPPRCASQLARRLARRRWRASKTQLAAALPADVVLINPPRTGVHEQVAAPLQAIDAGAARGDLRELRPGDARARPLAHAALSHRVASRVRHVSANGARRDRVRARAGGRMKYFVRIGDEEHEVVLDGDGVHIDGEDVAAHAEQIDGTPVRMVTIGDEVHRVVVRPGASRGLYTLWLDGYRFEVEALDERTRAIRELAGKAAGPSGPAPLIAPMPGLIVRVNVQVGDAVQAGQGLVVMEAMKMENELRAQAAGKVRSILVDAGHGGREGRVADRARVNSNREEVQDASYADRGSRGCHRSRRRRAHRRRPTPISTSRRSRCRTGGRSSALR